MSVSPISTLDTGTLQPTYAADPTSWDTTPTSGSNKPVTSGGVYTAINEDTGWLTLQDGITYRKKNGLVCVYVNLSGNNIPTMSANTWTEICTMPSDYRPQNERAVGAFWARATSGAAYTSYFVDIISNG